MIPTTTPPGIAYAPGFDINSFALAVPQVRIGAYKGTEAVIRYIALDVGDVELGSVSLIGVGGRHSISQCMDPDFPVDIAAGLFWQKFTLGDELIDATAMTFGVQAGKRFPSGFAVIEPYCALSVQHVQDGRGVPGTTTVSARPRPSSSRWRAKPAFARRWAFTPRWASWI